jgi:uroporphyrinogen-III synthase
LERSGERSATLAETLRARPVRLSECFSYRWLMPADTRELAGLVGSIIAGEVDALVVTCQVQFRNLYAVARSLSLASTLVDALRGGVVVAAMGPTCHATLQLHGVPVQVMPEVPKMGPLIRSLMQHLMQASLQPRALQPHSTVH